MSFFLFVSLTVNLQSCGFVVYQNNKLFQSKTFTTKTNFSQKIISGTINKNEKNQSPSVEMVFRPQVSFPVNKS